MQCVVIDMAEDSAGAEERVVGVIELDAECVDEVLGGFAGRQGGDGGFEMEALERGRRCGFQSLYDSVGLPHHSLEPDSCGMSRNITFE